jgi:Asp/Glu/hydantoin racemase
MAAEFIVQGSRVTTKPHILLINPNSSEATTRMMVAIAERAARGHIAMAAATATRSPVMIVTAGELAASAAEVVEIGSAHDPACLGIIVSAFGDPGVEELRSRLDIPVTGICEASMRDAARGARRFGVATVTPDLLDAIADHARRLGLSDLYTGARCPVEAPLSLMTDQSALQEILGRKVEECIDLDGAHAVIIGGGPLGQAAESLRDRFAVPVLSPITSAIEQMLGLIAGS